jgi:hypothetical protein
MISVETSAIGIFYDAHNDDRLTYRTIFNRFGFKEQFTFLIICSVLTERIGRVLEHSDMTLVGRKQVIRTARDRDRTWVMEKKGRPRS